MIAAQAVATGRGAGLQSARLLYVAACLVTALGALPLLIAAPAPLQDWPNHLARVHILDEMLRGAGPWAAYYDLNSFLLPNIVLDLGVLGLLRLGLGLDLAGAVFLLLTYAVFVTGFVRLSAALGAHDAVKPLLGATLFYNVALFWGFVNYVFGIGMLLWVVGLWLAASRTRVRLAVAVLGSAATFACHLIPACLIVGVLGLLDLHALVRAGLPLRPSLLRHCTSLAAAGTVLLLLAASPTGGDDMGSVSYYGMASVLDFAQWKATLFPKSFLRGGVWADAGFALFGLVLAAAALWAARLRIGGPMLLVVLVLALLSLVAPKRVGEGDYFDFRLAIVPLVLAAAAVQLRWRRPAGPALVVAAAAALVLVRGAALAAAWRDAGRTYATVEAALAELPPGGVLLTARGRSLPQLGFGEFWTPPMSHVSALAARHGVFVPSVFAYATQQPLVLDERFRGLIGPFDLGTPERLKRRLARLRAMCPGGGAETTFPAVWVAVSFPQPFMQPPRFKPVVPNYALVDACAAP